MCEPASDTSDEQRFDEMFIHLTPRAAVVPYSVCLDPDGHIWVSAKGGLFKFDGKTKRTLWERKNMVAKRMGPFPQVAVHDKKVVATCSEHQDNMTVLRTFDFSGNMINESFVDGTLFSLTISTEGEIYITKPPKNGVSTIYKTDVDAPIGWDEVISADPGEAFYAIHTLDQNTLVAAVATLPLHQFSKQRMVFINLESGKITKSFSKEGRNDGEIFFPRAIRSFNDGILVMDKSGRFLEFDRNGTFVGVKAEIDAFLSNGFCIKDGKEALIALSGIVKDPEGHTICDDWLEFLTLDGSSWKKQRQAKLNSK